MKHSIINNLIKNKIFINNTATASLTNDTVLVTAPLANYKAYILDNNILYISGQLSFIGDELITGRLIDNDDKAMIAKGQKAARACGKMIINQLATAIENDWTKFSKFIKLTAFVQTGKNFTLIPQIINGASDLMVDVFLQQGMHARAAVGVSSLPLGAMVEIEAMIALS